MRGAIEQLRQQHSCGAPFSTKRGDRGVFMLQVCLWHSVVGWVRVCKTLNRRRREWGSGRWLTFGFRLVCKGTEDTHKAVRLATRTNELNSRGSTNIPGMIAGENTWCESSHRHAEPFIWGGINTCHSVWEAGAQFTSCTPPPTDMTEAPERIRWFKKKNTFTEHWSDIVWAKTTGEKTFSTETCILLSPEARW